MDLNWLFKFYKSLWIPQAVEEPITCLIDWYLMAVAYKLVVHHGLSSTPPCSQHQFLHPGSALLEFLYLFPSVIDYDVEVSVK